METSSYFIPNKALFGSMPDQKRTEILEEIGVRYFVDLTCPKETYHSQYKTQYEQIKFPIQDRRIPKDVVEFSKFVYKLYKIIKHLETGKKVYVHCRGGHGRSGIVVACLLCLYHKIPPEDALHMTQFYHQQRKEMRDKWRRIGSPQTQLQKAFVIKMFTPIYFNSRMNTFLSSSFVAEIEIKNLGVFKTVESAYQAMKNPSNAEYVKKIQLCESPKELKNIGKTTQLRNDWLEKREEIMYSIVKAKFEQHPELLQRLLDTCLGPIVAYSTLTTFWKDRQRNRLGKLLQKVRNEFLYA
jgi:ribA/ribD-fused uncharacterized protein